MRFLKSSTQALGFLFLALVLFCFMSVRQQPSLGQGEVPGEPTQERPGDVNCDGRLNISDAVWILQYLFVDGEPPCAVAQGEPSPCCPEVLEELAALRERVDSLGHHPGAQDIVIQEGTSQFGAQGGNVTIFTVPDDKWLVPCYAPHCSRRSGPVCPALTSAVPA